MPCLLNRDRHRKDLLTAAPTPAANPPRLSRLRITRPKHESHGNACLPDLDSLYRNAAPPNHEPPRLDSPALGHYTSPDGTHRKAPGTACPTSVFKELIQSQRNLSLF